jgi:enamine deaminase RidA (YjgF/YER057c/UK114 family)
LSVVAHSVADMTTTGHLIPGQPPIAGMFPHATSAPAGRLVLLSGQTGADADGAVVEGGLSGQVEQALVNVGLAVEAAGGTVSDVLRLRFYVVGWDPAKLDDFMAGGGAAMAKLPDLARAAVTVIGVQALFTPDVLVEVEAEAMVA